MNCEAEMLVRMLPIATLALALISIDAHAAVRKCGPAITSDVASASTETEAKKTALAQWRGAARKRGEGFDSWRLAAGKTLKCFPAASGFECVAHGSPCIIDQTPRSPPKGTGTGI
ncbi:MAG: hypothetical protein IKE66_07910 [Hyphomicrobium sp.]|nr:hypothetical protein [Hyphomicrobium sp.]